MRLIVAKADRKFQHLQRVLINRFLTPVWGYVIGNAIARGELPSCENWNKVIWTTPKRVTVDAGRDAAQNRADIEFGLKTIGENCQEEGEHFSTMLRRRAVEAKMFIDASKEYGVPLWMLLKPTNVGLQDISDSDNVEADEQADDENEKGEQKETQLDIDDAESDEQEDPLGR